MRALNPRTLITSLALLACVGAILLALRWYESRYVRPFNTQATVFSGEQLRLPAELAGPGPIRLVHFWDPACPCNAGNQQHLAELIQRFAPQGVTFHAVQKPGSKGHLPPGLEALQPLAMMPGSEQLPAVPAVGIWDRDGRLAYFGPYSEGAVCNSANSFIEPILEALIDNRPVSASSTLAAGCFCAWRKPS
ncbi:MULTISPECIES: DUF6436 domain-containing protein [unclassified Pseudomonas]|uniref:DUF6436 domain-containing protein n=1 Tax=unclassified Pseudomonas TaxID=196821 RepID=UPI000EA95143|nr:MULTISPECIES: DUF6436 domain-containing protein [unclassified Pseudomonas]AYF89069.1 thiol-disulfide isomerase [Pseudomonas sp. DY-1]MDH4653268.1 thiol-disulfide isomerase [Pseudomonas sp. BN606]MRK21011.1 thiol-disulfide isomerase [Pseudomonas sp. JG-B]